MRGRTARSPVRKTAVRRAGHQPFVGCVHSFFLRLVRGKRVPYARNRRARFETSDSSLPRRLRLRHFRIVFRLRDAHRNAYLQKAYSARKYQTKSRSARRRVLRPRLCAYSLRGDERGAFVRQMLRRTRLGITEIFPCTSPATQVFPPRSGLRRASPC